jgi:hypothetical protein
VFLQFRPSKADLKQFKSLVAAQTQSDFMVAKSDHGFQLVDNSLLYTVLGVSRAVAKL